MFKSFGWPELLVVLFIVLLIFGGSRLPQVGRSMGQSIREFKKGISGGDGEKPPPPTEKASPPASSGSGRIQH